MNLLPILEVSVVPVGTGSPSISSYVSEACKAAKDRGLEFSVTPTSTVVSGDLDSLFDVAKDMHRRVLGNGATRVVTSFSIDDRQDRPMDLQQPVRTVAQDMAH